MIFNILNVNSSILILRIFTFLLSYVNEYIIISILFILFRLSRIGQASVNE